ncbi:MAG: LysM peptidoglycan-binding domain-containing protein [Bacteroidota bacterium]
MTALYYEAWFRSTIVTFAVIFFGFSLNAATNSNSAYLSLQDTIFIRVNAMGVKTYQHTFQSNQNIEALIAFYSISMQELKFFNPRLNENNLQAGQKVIVPIPNRAIIRYKNPKVYDVRTCIPVFHIVKKGETLFGISKRLYNMPQVEIKERNQLASDRLKEGQRIHIGWLDIKGIPPGQEGEVTNPVLKANMPYRNAYFQQINVKDEWEHKGLAVRQAGGNFREGFVVYHAHAQMNSYIRITNPMNKATIYAKVIGRIPITLQHKYKDKDVVLAYSPTIGKALGVIDPQFFADIRFVK